MQLFGLCLLFPMFVAPRSLRTLITASAAEVRCVTCHMVAPSPRREVADPRRLT